MHELKQCVLYLQAIMWILTKKMRLVMTHYIWLLRMRVAVQNMEIIKLLNY